MNTAVAQKTSEKAIAQVAEPEIYQMPDGYMNATQSLAVSLARAEIDQQVTTARALPRSIEKAVKNTTMLATLDGETAKECIYALPRGGTPIKGPSIRLAEIIQSQWGNCRVGARVVHVDRREKFVEAEGIFHDLETNSASTARVRRSIADKSGKIYKDDMIIVTGNAACSIAKRNAILAGVPKAVWRGAYAAVEKVLVGDVKTLAVRRTEAMKAFAAFGVKPEQIFIALKIKGLEELDGDHYVTLVGMHAALRSGEETVETMFPKGTGDAPARPEQKDFKATAAKPEEKTGVSGTKADKVIIDGVDQQTGEVEYGPPEAYREGAAAKLAGKGLDAMPVRLKQFPDLQDAWIEGWNSEAAPLL